MYIILEASVKLQLTKFKNMKCPEPYHTQAVPISIKVWAYNCAIRWPYSKSVFSTGKYSRNIVLPHSTNFHLNRTKQLEIEANISPRWSTGNFFVHVDEVGVPSNT